MSQFFGIDGDKAKLEFALVVLHTMPEGDVKTLDVVFDEAKSACVLDEKIIEQLRQEAKSILPVKFFYNKGEEADMEKFKKFRDKIISICT